jgi:general secretion pathway protein J
VNRRRNSGFTLIEVLVSTTILAIMAGLMSSALFAVTRTARAGEGRLDDSDATRLTLAFLRRVIENAAPLTDIVDGERHALFEGTGDELRFVGHLPAHRGGGGLQFLELRTEGANLVLCYRSAWPEIPFASEDGSWEEHTLIAGVERVHYRYFGEIEDGARPQWRESWPSSDRLPALVEIRIDASGRHWPPVRAAVRTRRPTAQGALFRVHDGTLP